MINNTVIIILNPLIDFLLVRTSWEKIVISAEMLLVIDQEGANQNRDWI